jgi:CheY-like chemotaxis protein
MVQPLPGAESALADLVSGGRLGGIVLNLVMDGMDGFDFLKHLRPRDRNIPVIVWTAADLTDSDRARLPTSPCGIALKEGDADALLSEIQLHVPTGPPEGPSGQETRGLGPPRSA